MIFRVGSVSELLEPEELCGGATDDYYFSTQNINLTYTVVSSLNLVVVMMMSMLKSMLMIMLIVLVTLVILVVFKKQKTTPLSSL